MIFSSRHFLQGPRQGSKGLDRSMSLAGRFEGDAANHTPTASSCVVGAVEEAAAISEPFAKENGLMAFINDPDGGTLRQRLWKLRSWVWQQRCGEERNRGASFCTI